MRCASCFKSLLKYSSSCTQSPAQLDAAVAELANMFPDADPDFLRTLVKTQEPPYLENAASQLLSAKDYPKRQGRQPISGAPQPGQEVAAHGQRQPPPPTPGAGGGLFSNLRRQFGKGERNPSPVPPPPILSPPAPGPRPPTEGARSGTAPAPTQTHKPGSTPTSIDIIRANLTRAIQVCAGGLGRRGHAAHRKLSRPQAAKPESGSEVSNTVEQTEVKESEAYCDATAAADLAFIAEIGGLRFFAARDVPDP